MAKLVLFKGVGGEDVYLNPQHVEAVIAGEPSCRVEMASGTVWILDTRAEDAIRRLNSSTE